MKLDSLQSDHVACLVRGRRFLAQLGTSDGRIVPQLRIRVLRVEFQSYLSGRLVLHVGRLVFVGEVQEIVSQCGVVVVLQPAWRELTGDECLDVGLGKTSFGMSTQVAGDAWGGLEARYGVL